MKTLEYKKILNIAKVEAEIAQSCIERTHKLLREKQIALPEYIIFITKRETNLDDEILLIIKNKKIAELFLSLLLSFHEEPDIELYTNEKKYPLFVKKFYKKYGDENVSMENRQLFLATYKPLLRLTKYLSKKILDN